MKDIVIEGQVHFLMGFAVGLFLAFLIISFA
mgnify:CR=1 FL=1